MRKVLPYCAFLDREGISRPRSGVGGAALKEMAEGKLRLLWSEVEWPFDSAVLQHNAVEFHRVISHLFSQGAVAPFRLLSVFDDQESLASFIAAHHVHFIADLERLEKFVQMECVLYVGREAAIAASGKAYLELKAELLRGVEGYVQSLREALSPISQGMQVKESRNGSRIFVLVKRGDEARFHSLVQDLPIPDRLSRRLSGPWPATEFLSQSVRMPQAVEQK
jgi:Gas vesicle synthesis protein GvpL/GvpF